MKSNDFVKFLTKEFVSYVDQPKAERKHQRQRPKRDLKNEFFGLVPLSISIMMKRFKK
ncbi:MAG: YqzE family protein [Bacillus sp. (in: firmicutes)]